MEVIRQIILLLVNGKIINFSNSVLIEWFTGSTMKSTSELNTKTLPLAYNTSSSYRVVAILNTSATDAGGETTLYSKTASNVVFRYTKTTGSASVNTFEAIAIGYKN